MPDIALAIRLKKARERAGLTLSDAASKIGFANYQTLSSIEKGEREVKASELALCAKHYFCNMASLLMEEPLLGAEEVCLLWRKPPPEDKRAETEASIKLRLENYHLVETLLGIDRLGNPQPLNVRPEDIQNDINVDHFAKQTSDVLNLGSRPAFTLPKVLEQTMQTKVLYVDLSDLGSAASSVHSKLGAAIVVNFREVPWRINFTLAHELFHILTWNLFTPQQLQGDTIYFEVVEKKAERFASTLLLPAEPLKAELSHRIVDGKLEDTDVIEVAYEFGVSTLALLYRMKNLGWLTYDQVTEVKKNEEFSRLDRQMRSEKRISTPFSERFILLAIKCLRKALISRGKFAEIVEIDRAEIDDFVEAYGLPDAGANGIEVMAI